MCRYFLLNNEDQTTLAILAKKFDSSSPLVLSNHLGPEELYSRTTIGHQEGILEASFNSKVLYI